MKKKVVSLMLVLSMAAAMFAGCGSSGKDSSKDEAKKDDSKPKPEGVLCRKRR